MPARWLAWNELTDAHLQAWGALEASGESANAFGTPSWIAPSVLAGAAAPAVIWVGRDAEPRAVLAVQAASPSVRVPFPHWRAFWSAHTYQSGVSGQEDEALAELADAIARSERPALELVAQAVGPSSEALDEAFRRRGGTWIDRRRWERACIALDGHRPAAAASKNQRKKARRAERRLEELGPIHVRTYHGADALGAPLDAFLGLEHQGWKSHAGTSIRAAMNREAWLNEVARSFALRHGLVITQLCAGDRVASSSLNLVTGDVAFGLKIGWDIGLADASPGMLHEHHFVEQAAEVFAGVRLVDAVADPGSFVEKVWPDRRVVRTGAYTFGAARIAALIAARTAARRRTT